MHRIPLAALRGRPQPTSVLLAKRHIQPIQPFRRRFSARSWNRQYEQPRQQRIVFQQASATPLRRAITLAVYTGLAYSTVVFIVKKLGVEVQFVGDEWEEVKAGEEEEDDIKYPEADENGIFWADEDSTFIPMTWMKQMPRTFYKGSDPEWQEFVKMAKDKKRQQKVLGELVRLVEKNGSKHPLIARHLGKDIKVGKYWLDISFPDGPPPEFRRSGIEIGDGYVAWSEQKVNPEKHWRIMRALWPRAAFDSAWASGKIVVGMQWRRFKQALGVEKDPKSPEEQYLKAIEYIEKQDQATGKKRGSMAPLFGFKGDQISPSGPTSPLLGAATASANQSKDAAEGEPEGKKSLWDLTKTPTLSDLPLEVPMGILAFTATLMKGWNPKKQEPPRGTIVVQGMVEMRSPRGMVLFDVKSFYHPKERKFVVVDMAVKNVKAVSQRPKGGR